MHVHIDEPRQHREPLAVDGVPAPEPAPDLGDPAVLDADIHFFHAVFQDDFCIFDDHFKFPPL